MLRYKKIRKKNRKNSSKNGRNRMSRNKAQDQVNPADHAEMLYSVLHVFSFLDYANFWDGKNGSGFDDLPELPDLRDLSIYAFLSIANRVADLLCRIRPVKDRSGSKAELDSTMEKWLVDTHEMNWGERQVVADLADWVIRIMATMEEVSAAAQLDPNLGSNSKTQSS